MTRQLEAKIEQRALRQKERALLSVYGGLEDGVSRAGGALLGFTVSYRGGDVLMVLKADFPAGRMIAFVGAEDLPEVLSKAAKEAASDALRWKEDKWGRDEG